MAGSRALTPPGGVVRVKVSTDAEEADVRSRHAGYLVERRLLGPGSILLILTKKV